MNSEEHFQQITRNSDIKFLIDNVIASSMVESRSYKKCSIFSAAVLPYLRDISVKKKKKKIALQCIIILSKNDRQSSLMGLYLLNQIPISKIIPNHYYN